MDYSEIDQYVDRFYREQEEAMKAKLPYCDTCQDNTQHSVHLEGGQYIETCLECGTERVVKQPSHRQEQKGKHRGGR